MNKWIWIVVALVVLAGGFWWWSTQSAQAPAVDRGASSAMRGASDQGGAAANASGTSTDASAHTTNVPAPTNTGAAMSATVTYDGSSFSPSSVAIAKGGTVKFVDSARGSMWVASGQHPTHTGYDGTSASQHCAAGYSGPAPFDQCGVGTSFSFTFNRVGTWGYHNHVNTSAFGKVIVQ